jgi:thiamine-monophosphate kinase
MASGEFEKIARLLSLFGSGAGPSVLVGIGDDAAVLARPDAPGLVWTIDAQVEGVHFRAEWLSWEDVGWRSFMAAASDLAAMGSTPWCALSALALPVGFGDEALLALATGQKAAAGAVGAPVVGGNLARAGVVSVTTTLLGTSERAIERRGARPGDGLFVAGPVGLAGAGMRALVAGVMVPAVDAAIAAFRRPVARIADGLAMAKVARAAIDVSDGLSQDAAHVAEASDVCVVLDERALLAHAGDALARAAEAVGADALSLALGGGEDYALVVASADTPPGFTRIGEVRDGEGLVLRSAAGERALDPRGFDHFAG